MYHYSTKMAQIIEDDIAQKLLDQSELFDLEKDPYRVLGDLI